MSPLEGSIARANRLLVLDDDPFIPRWIRKVAEHEGYDVSICTDLTTIRAVHRSARPTLILMDLTLGGGYQGLEALRLLSAERSTTPIILTGAAEPGVLHSASRFGMTLDLSMAGIIPKPIELGQLRRALAAHLHEQREVSTVDLMLSGATESPAPSAALAASPRRPMPRSPTRRACVRRSKPMNCGSTISRRSRCAPAPSSRWKRSCAGSIRCAD